MILSKIKIRETLNSDFKEIMRVEEEAFGYVKEAKLVADLLNDKSAHPLISLLAFNADEAIGHILFTRAYLNDSTNETLIHLLAPLAVVPKYQKMGIGGKLIIEGIKQIKGIGSKMVFVLGHMDYYPKFGFIPDANKQGYPAPFPIPSEFSNAWMVLPLSESMTYQGKVICANELNKSEHWRE
jgi:putative acetyltransferase